MKPFRFLLATMTLLCAIVSTAAPITADQAMTNARHFLNAGPMNRAPGLQMTLAYASRTNGSDAEYYVFNLGRDNGYVLVSGDDLAPAVLGYTDNGAFDYASLPDNLRWWLEQYRRDIQHLRSHPQTPVRKATQLSHHVNPLITSMWNQSEPYNNSCPTYTINNVTYRAVTGCVATAMAQIMYYHKWPTHGSGSNSYTCNVGGAGNQTLSANFDQSVYQWSQMLNDYDSNSSEASKNAVAKLMSDVGIAVNMNYKDGSSGAYSSSVPSALTTYFGYDQDMCMIYRDYHSVESWENLIINELNNSRPVYYSGSSESGGHAFVVDGYNADGYFHINWGWGGKSNGYFVLSMLNPDDQGIGSFEGGYNSSQQALIGVKPEDGINENGPFIMTYNELSANNSSVALGAETSIHIGQVMISGNGNPELLYWGFAVLDEAESQLLSYDWEVDAAAIQNNRIYRADMNFVPSASLTPGKYHIKPIFTTDGETIEYFKPGASTAPCVVMEVVGNTAYFTTDNSPNLSLVSLSCNSPTLYTNNTFCATAVIKNTGAEYLDSISFGILLPNGTVVTQSSAIQVGIAPDAETTVSTEMTAPSSAGNYRIVVYDASGNRIGDHILVTVEAAGAFAMELAGPLIPKSSSMPANAIKATVDVKNTGDTFMGHLQLFFLSNDPNDNKIKSILESELVTIGPNETCTVNFNCSVGGVVGKSYRLWLRNPNDLSKYYLWGQAVTITISDYPAASVPGDVNGDGLVNVLDINILVNIVLGRDTPDAYDGRADITGDGLVNVQDINQLVNLLLIN